MKRYLLSTCIAIVAGISSSSAQIVINTAPADRPVSFGVRIGGNVSNTSTNEASLMPAIEMYSPNWRGGVTAGFVADLNIRQYISIQPGIFYSSASHGFKRVSIGSDVDQPLPFASITTSTSVAHYIQVPVMASMKFECGPHIKLIGEVGPYFAWGFGGHEKYTVNRYDGNTGNPADRRHKRDYFGNGGVSHRFDWGFKMGAGVAFGDFIISAHYLAGCRDILGTDACNDPNADPMLRAGVKGHNKMWQFTAGYNF